MRSDLFESLRALNEAAYAALRAARKVNSPAADTLIGLARKTDDLVDTMAEGD